MDVVAVHYHFASYACASTPAGGCRTTEYVASTPLNPTSTPPATSPAPTTNGSNVNSSSNTLTASR